MVPDKFNMVDMEGIDLLESQGLEITGLYDKLVESITLCRHTILYNWKFDGVEIPPSYFELEVENNTVAIGDYVAINSDDILHIYSIQTEANIVPISIIENGIFSPPIGIDGYSPVTVNVHEDPVIQSLTVTEDGTYTAPSGVDGYSPVTVNVSNGPFALKDYIESSGTQYINTGYYLNAQSSVELVANITDSQSNYAIFGTRNASNGYFYIIRSVSAGRFVDNHGTESTNIGIPSIFTGKKIVFTKSSNYMIWGTEGIPRGYLEYTSDSATSYPLFIFALNFTGTASYLSTMKLYRFRIYEGTTLVHEFVPWIDGNDAVCLKDTVTNTLVYNAGTGNFTFGTDP